MIKARKWFYGVALSCVSFVASAQSDSIISKVKADDPEVAAIDRMLVSSYLNHFCFSMDSTLLNPFGYEEGQTPAFTADLISERMKVLDRETPFDLIYNTTVQGFIDLYAVRRKDVTRKVMGVSQLYFPMIEEQLAKHNMPLELKYLAIVESALNPVAISRVGAGGLWQFMPGTGKLYGLEITSYVDDRFDPIKSTEAACKYLKFLYETFDDWQLALAAYNSGPGNVNKAIRRSGGKKDFWSIKPYLPKETQGYVPAFIAVNYIMNHTSEYNIYPKAPLITCYEVDTVAVQGRLDFEVVSKIIDMPIGDIMYLNGTYKLGEVPENGVKHFITLPVNKIGVYLTNEDLIYAQSLIQPKYNGETLVASLGGNPASVTKDQVVWEDQWKTHKVRKGENISVIAKKYNVSASQIKSWNKLKSNALKAGQMLKIKTRVKKTIKVSAERNVEVAQNAMEVTDKPLTTEDSLYHENKELARQINSVSNQESKSNNKQVAITKTHVVKKGETLYSIANKYKLTTKEIMELNPGLNASKIKVGQKITIKTKK
jgi:membrane-bound lytic murein transglycosylase D